MSPLRVRNGSFIGDGGTVFGFWRHPGHGATHLVLDMAPEGNPVTPSLARFVEAFAGACVGAVRFSFPSAEAIRSFPGWPFDGRARLASAGSVGATPVRALLRVLPALGRRGSGHA